MYKIYVNDGYIISIAHGVTNGNITEEEYGKIQEAIKNKPVAPDGYNYRLTEQFEWELYELPIAEDSEDFQEATEQDYQNALAEMGVEL